MMNFEKDLKDKIGDKKSIIIMFQDDYDLKHGFIAFCNEDFIINYDQYQAVNIPLMIENSFYIFIQEKTPIVFLEFLIKKHLLNLRNVVFYASDFPGEKMEVFRFAKCKSENLESQNYQSEDLKSQNYQESEKEFQTYCYSYSRQSLRFMFNKLQKKLNSMNFSNVEDGIDEFSDEIIQENKEKILIYGQSIKEKIATNPDLVYIVPNGIIPSLQSLIVAQHFDNKNIEGVREKYFFNLSVNDTNLETIKFLTNLPKVSHESDKIKR